MTFTWLSYIMAGLDPAIQGRLTSGPGWLPVDAEHHFAMTAAMT